ncbi:hypothetical protein A0H81_13309 [Grifola frondosa]|uniref:Uncharacterized protein n=1 Tax=Grifola frondosa TaxID=5627 RepID=A0A1C7LRP7_GRIFR|nr:hypothetical protein A0H81_13309 [Grifola frondosa]
MTSLPFSTVPQTDPAIDDLIVEFSNIEMEHEYRRLARFYQNFKADLEDDLDDDANDPTRFLSMAMNELAKCGELHPLC